MLDQILYFFKNYENVLEDLDLWETYQQTVHLIMSFLQNMLKNDIERFL